MNCKEKPPSLRKTRSRQRGGRPNIRGIQGTFWKQRARPSLGAGASSGPLPSISVCPAPLYAASSPHTTQHDSTLSLYDTPPSSLVLTRYFPVPVALTRPSQLCSTLARDAAASLQKGHLSPPLCCSAGRGGLHLCNGFEGDCVTFLWLLLQITINLMA